MPCDVCGRRRLKKNLIPTLVPVTFVLDYRTMEKRTYPAGTLICPFEVRKLSTIGGGTTSEGQQIAYRFGAWRRDDCTKVI